MLSLLERRGEPPISTRSAREAARVRRRRGAAVYGGRPLPVAAARDLSIASGGGRARAAPLRPAGRDRRRAAARLLPRRRVRVRRPRHARRPLPAAVRARRHAGARGRTTASRPSTPSRPPSRTPSRRSAGRARTPTASARTRCGWRWAATAPAATSPRSCASCARATGRPQPAHAAAHLSRHRHVARAPLARAVRRGLLPDERRDGLVRGAVRGRPGRARHRPARVAAARRRTCPVSRPRSWRPPASTRCATRARSTRGRSSARARPPCCAASPA